MSTGDQPKKISNYGDGSDKDAGKKSSLSATSGKKETQRTKSIDKLESNIIGFEDGIAKLLTEQERMRQVLIEKRMQLKSEFRELQKTEKAIAAIKRDVSDKIQIFQDQVNSLEQKRIAITNDCKLTPDQTQPLLEELEEEMNELRRSHVNEIKMLAQKKMRLEEEAKRQADALAAGRSHMLQTHLNKLEQLEKNKIGCNPCELIKIEKEIFELGAEFEDNIKFMERAQNRKPYLMDDQGRYYMNQQEQKVYKEHSTASEYVANPDGTLVQVAPATDTLTDELGTYYLDPFGRKIYSKKYFHDAYGRYYLDKDGRRVYKSDNQASEYILVDGEMVKIKEGTYARDEFGQRLEVESTHSLEMLINKEQQHAMESRNYVKQTVGKALRKGLAAVILHQPYDPINYLANFLLHYNANQRRYAQEREMEQESAAMRILQAVSGDAAVAAAAGVDCPLIPEEIHCDTKSKHSYFID